MLGTGCVAEGVSARSTSAGGGNWKHNAPPTLSLFFARVASKGLTERIVDAAETGELGEISATDANGPSEQTSRRTRC